MRSVTKATETTRNRDYGVLLLVFVLLVLGVAFSLLAPGKFATPANFANIGKDVAIMGICAAAFTLALTGGAIDFSIASVIAGAAFMMAYLMDLKIPWPVVVLLTLAAGAVVGLFNSLIVTRLQANPFIVTLATASIVRGALYQIAGGPAGKLIKDKSFIFIGQGTVGGFPFVILVMITVYIMAYIVLNLTHLGRRLCAVGGNPAAARHAGLNVRREVTVAYLISSMGAALAGIVAASVFAGGQPTIAIGWEFPIVTAVILGGTSLWGGTGNIPGTFIAMILLGMLRNGFLNADVSSYYQTVAGGALLIAAVAIDRWRLARQNR